ncbi:FAD-binding domain-containing protein [Whalleya microplaca]|nr:FAD-binding domain-containing protein [Whalleya microplaca]
MRLFLALASAAGITGASAFNYSCLPGQPCWPTAEQWSAFNQSIGGVLKVTHPFGEACYADPTSEACLRVAENYVNSTTETRSSVYGQTMNLNWEACGNDQCLLNSLAPTQGISGTCKLGRLSAYYVEATTADHVSATLKFVKKHGIRLSIKNTGHDYYGRSTAPNSLALWVRNMREMSYHDKFSVHDDQFENVGIIGAGVSAVEAFTYFERYNMHITVGAVASVGIAGGFGQGGGHGPLGPTYGLMVDQAIEFDVVTADGVVRTINKYNDPDLFWAMRGGGGGTFAVLLRYKLQLHKALPMNVYAFAANLTNSTLVSDLTKSPVHRDVVTALANNQTMWSNNKIAGYNFFLPSNIISVQVLPSNDTQALKNLTSEYATFLGSIKGLSVISNQYVTLKTYSEYAAFMLPFLETNGPVGVGIAEASRLIPRKQFQGTDNVEALVDAFLQGLQISNEQGAGLGTGSGQIYATGPANTNDEENTTGVNPAWRGSLWEVIHGGIWTSTDSSETRTQIQKTVGEAIKGFKALTPGGGTYLNEGDYTEEDWEQAFFGSKYDSLLRIKQQYDPTGLFNCWKCVGFTGETDPFYSCYGLGGVEETPTMPLDSSQNKATAP